MVGVEERVLNWLCFLNERGYLGVSLWSRADLSLYFGRLEDLERDRLTARGSAFNRTGSNVGVNQVGSLLATYPMRIQNIGADTGLIRSKKCLMVVKPVIMPLRTRACVSLVLTQAS